MQSQATKIVYFLQHPATRSEVKIGKSTVGGFPGRYAELSAMGALDVLAVVAAPDDKPFHRYFMSFHIERERFRYEGNLASYVEWCSTRPWCATSLGTVDTVYPAPYALPWNREDEEDEVDESNDWRLFEVEPIRHSIPESMSDDWQTAPLYLRGVRDVLGEIVLDPCSNPDYNEVVRAQHIFTIHDDALRHSWKAATVYMNPPFGGVAGEWVAKLIAEFDEGHVGAAILTVPTRATSNEWFDPLWRFAICITHHRPYFRHPDGSWGNSPGGHVFSYLGSNSSLFIERFREFGATGILKPPTTTDRRDLRRRSGWHRPLVEA